MSLGRSNRGNKNKYYINQSLPEKQTHWDLSIHLEIYYVVFAHPIMEIKKSHNLEIVSWRARRAGGVI